eukprot:1857163-Amphidinium_carterae.2
MLSSTAPSPALARRLACTGSGGHSPSWWLHLLSSPLESRKDGSPGQCARTKDAKGILLMAFSSL